MNDENSIITEEFKKKIIDEVLLPHLETRIKNAVNTETCWATVSTICWVSSTITLMVSAIIAFSSAAFPQLPMGFIAGILIVVGTGLKDFTSFSTNQDHIKTIEINDILKNINIDFILSDQSILNKLSNKHNKEQFTYNNTFHNNALLFKTDDESKA